MWVDGTTYQTKYRMRLIAGFRNRQVSQLVNERRSQSCHQIQGQERRVAGACDNPFMGCFGQAAFQPSERPGKTINRVWNNAKS